MKDLGRTIDKLLRVEPTLQPQLSSIKKNWKKNPSKTMEYWQELLTILNSEPLLGHPRRHELRSIVVNRPKQAHQQLYTFEETRANDRIVGVIPEHLADFIRRHDSRMVRMAKKQTEANMTRNVALMAQVSREETLLNISANRIWLALKDYFSLWEKPQHFSIRKRQGMLVLVEDPPTPPSMQANVMRIDPRKLFGMLGIEPPPEE